MIVKVHDESPAQLLATTNRRGTVPMAFIATVNDVRNQIDFHI